MEDLYSTLGVDRDATQEDIQKAYRKAAQRTHPDKEGGSEEAFKQVAKAFDILGNTEKRKDYDETGSTGEPTPRSLAQQVLASLVEHYVERGLGKDPVAFMRMELVKAIESQSIKHKTAKKSLEKLGRLLNHIKPGKSPVVLVLLKARQAAMTAEVKADETAIEAMTLAKDMLQGYTYDGPVEEQFRSSSSSMDELLRYAMESFSESSPFDQSFRDKARKKAQYGSSYGPQK